LITELFITAGALAADDLLYLSGSHGMISALKLQK